MKRIRNPRYAPEFLERKLCPSGFGGFTVPSAVYSTPDPALTQDVAAPPDFSLDQGFDPALANPFADDLGSIDLSFADMGAADPGDGDPDPGSDDPSDDPSEPDVPEPPDAIGGDPPLVPPPPIPIGPAVPAV